jgi:hypothetical protein
MDLLCEKSSTLHQQTKALTGLKTSLLSALNERGGNRFDLKGQRHVDSFCLGGNERNM